MSLYNDHFPDTIKPRHLTFSTVGASSVSTVLVPVVSGVAAYTGTNPLGSSVSHTSFNSSSFIYVTYSAGITTLTETIHLSDDYVAQDAVTSEIVEKVIVLDSDITSYIPVAAVQPFYGARNWFTLTDQPTYTNITGLDNSASHTVYKSITEGVKGYSLSPMDGGVAHFGYQNSGWQYYLTGNTNYETTLYEYVTIGDDYVTSESPGQTTLFEFFLSDESETQNPITSELSEYFLLSDGASAEIDPNLPVSFEGTLVIHVMDEVSFNASNVIHVEAALEDNFTVDVGVLANDLAPITSASGALNPAEPTLIINGQVLFSNPSTLPSTIPTNGCRTYFPCTGLIGNLSMDQVLSFSINLEDAGGSWDVKSIADMGAFGTQESMYGLSGLVVNKGFEWTSSGSAYTNSGIFGLRSMNREVAFLAYGKPAYTKNLVTKYMNYPQPEFYKTHKDAAYMIAYLAGAEIQWQIPDFPLPNFQLQGGQTALSALQSLASDCGGTVRWAGGNTYKVMFPDVSLGTWWVPDCCLILSVNRQCHLDLNSGYYNPGVRVLPQLNQFDSTQQNLTTDSNGISIINNPLNLGSRYKGQVENKITIGKLFTSDTPETPYDLPMDTAHIFIRVITKDDPSGNYVITESEAQASVDGNWFYLEEPGGSHSTYTFSDRGEVKLQFKATSDLFPATNGDVQAGNFSLQIGVARKQPPYVDNAAGSSLLAAQQILKYRFVPTCTGTMTVNFFGSIPMPGMRLVANFNNTPITGIIESVSFSGPNTLTVNFVEWSRFEFYQQLSESGNF